MIISEASLDRRIKILFIYKKIILKKIKFLALKIMNFYAS